MRIRPEVIFSSPPIERRRVVLPHPDGPTSTMNSPSSIVRFTSSTARTPGPNSFVTLSRTISPIRRGMYPLSKAGCNRCHTDFQRHRLADVTTLSPLTVAGVSRYADTCNVYVLRSGRDAVVVDFGSGDVLDHLAAFDVDRVTDVLLTHHHRDQLQGLQRAVDVGARIWVPPVERELIEDVDRHWLTRPIDNDYDLLQDRFSLLEPVTVTGTV